MKIQFRNVVCLALALPLISIARAQQAGAPVSFVTLGASGPAATTLSSPPAQAPAATSAVASIPRFEWFVGYSDFREIKLSNPDNRLAWLSGGSTSLAVNVNRYLGIVFDVGAYHANRFGPGAPPSGGVVPAQGNVLTYQVGPRLSWRNGRWTPFIQVLLGEVDAHRVTLNDCSGVGCSPLPYESTFGLNLGGGLDLTLAHHLAWRVFQVEYASTRFHDPLSSSPVSSNQNDTRLSTGLVFRFGGFGGRAAAAPLPAPPPPVPVQPAPAPAAAIVHRPPTMTCAADPNSLQAGDRARITATAQSPGGSALVYTWSANAGQIQGSGASAIFDTTGLAAGTYTQTARVVDDRGGAAECSVNVTVQPAPAPLPVVLAHTLALHSIYFGTDQPGIATPDSGLAVSQQAVLATLAVNFKQYLGFQPDARLTLEGHADERASESYNDALAQRRVAIAKQYLVAQGVPEASIDTLSFGKHQELDAAQVSQQIQNDPDLGPDERQKLLANLPSIILAQNRRVDIVLSTTGQKSERRYPFNAKDALSLLNDSSVSH